jgi:hypothetical protein
MDRVLLSLSLAVIDRLREEPNMSAFVDAMLHAYYQIPVAGEGTHVDERKAIVANIVSVPLTTDPDLAYEIPATTEPTPVDPDPLLTEPIDGTSDTGSNEASDVRNEVLDGEGDVAVEPVPVEDSEPLPETNGTDSTDGNTDSTDGNTEEITPNSEPVEQIMSSTEEGNLGWEDMQPQVEPTPVIAPSIYKIGDIIVTEDQYNEYMEAISGVQINVNGKPGGTCPTHGAYEGEACSETH